MNRSQTRRRILGALAAAPAALSSAPLWAAPSDLEIAAASRALFLPNDRAGGLAGLATLRAVGNLTVAPTLIFALRFSVYEAEIVEELHQLFPEERARDDWFDWMLFQEGRPDIVPHPSYYLLKRAFYLSIDRNFENFLRLEHMGRDAARIRFEEVTWGGRAQGRHPLARQSASARGR